MTAKRISSPAFFWAVGIENTVNPALGWDQYAWTAHRHLWREDFRRAADLGVSHIRYGVPWPDVNPAPGVFEWVWADEVLDELARLGLEPIWDLLHFGGPGWLRDGLLDVNYPQAVAEYARAFARRYPQVTKITPFNEPYIWSFFTGGNGTWAPHGLDRGLEVAGFARSLWPVLQGLRGSIKAIREVNPRAEIWLNDGADRFRAATPELAPLAESLTGLRYAAFDVLHGLLDTESEVYRALVKVAGSQPENQLDDMLADPTPADVIGLDYYPGSDHLIFPPGSPKHPGDWGRREDYRLYPDPHPPGLAATLLEYHHRYGAALYIAETSTDTRREDWLRWVGSETLKAQAGGANVLGCTWWPLFDHVDWNSGLTRLEGFVCPSGLYHLTPQIHSRQESDFVPFFRDFIQQPLRSSAVSAPVPQDAVPLLNLAL